MLFCLLLSHIALKPRALFGRVLVVKLEILVRMENQGKWSVYHFDNSFSKGAAKDGIHRTYALYLYL